MMKMAAYISVLFVGGDSSTKLQPEANVKPCQVMPTAREKLLPKEMCKKQIFTP